jgi:Fe2+ transport system protein FeoA
MWGLAGFRRRRRHRGGRNEAGYPHGQISERVCTLDVLKPGATGTVVNVQGNGALHQRILEMGLIEGAPIKVVRLAPLGDPMEITVWGYHLSLRKAEAALVEVHAH